MDDFVGDHVDGGRGNDYMRGGVGDTLIGGADRDILELNIAEIREFGSATQIVGRTPASITIPGSSIDEGAFTIRASQFEVLL